MAADQLHGKHEQEEVQQKRRARRQGWVTWKFNSRRGHDAMSSFPRWLGPIIGEAARHATPSPFRTTLHAPCRQGFTSAVWNKSQSSFQTSSELQSGCCGAAGPLGGCRPTKHQPHRCRVPDCREFTALIRSAGPPVSVSIFLIELHNTRQAAPNCLSLTFPSMHSNSHVWHCFGVREYLSRSHVRMVPLSCCFT